MFLRFQDSRLLTQLANKHGENLEEKSLTICSGTDYININYQHVVCPDAATAKVSLYKELLCALNRFSLLLTDMYKTYICEFNHKCFFFYFVFFELCTFTCALRFSVEVRFLRHTAYTYFVFFLFQQRFLVYKQISNFMNIKF